MTYLEKYLEMCPKLDTHEILITFCPDQRFNNIHPDEECRKPREYIPKVCSRCWGREYEE